MKAAVKSCQEGKGLRETSRLYNVPVETLRRRVTGAVEMGCRSGPPTVFTEEQEDQLSEHLVKVSEMGFGLTRDYILHLAFNMAELTGQSHRFREGKAGRGWFEGFMSRHQNLTLRKHSLCLTAELCVPTRKRSMISSGNWGGGGGYMVA